jgi:hypothetical protein
MTATALFAAVLAAASAAPGSEAASGGGLHRVPDNLLQNSSFEHDWVHRSFVEQRRFQLLQASDMGVGESDGRVDHWRLTGVSPVEAWDTAVARSGRRSIRFDKPGQASQLVRFAGEQHWRAGGAYYAMFLPMDERLADRLPRRPIVVGAWCRTSAVPAGQEPQLVVTVECAVREGGQALKQIARGRLVCSASFAAGTQDWHWRQVRIDPKLDSDLTGEGLKGTPFYVTVALVNRSRTGTVWFDDASCVEPVDPGASSLLSNGGFEALDANGWPTGWAAPALWTWFRNTYYTWTGWSHSDSKIFRGGATVDRGLTFSGNASLRMTVLPGDNFAVASPLVTLNQDKPHPLEVRAMVKADNLRTLEIMALDEAGQPLPQGDFLGDDMEEPGAYNFGSTGCGTYDWLGVRKYFSPRKPVKSLRLLLCVRGFDGRICQRNVVGTVWWDDVRLYEHVGAGQHPAASQPAVGTAAKPLWKDLRILDVDLGDRLWGRNIARVALSAAGAEAERLAGRLTCRLTLAGPDGQVREFAGPTRLLRRAGDGRQEGLALAEVPYVIERLCRTWQEQYTLRLRLDGPPGEDGCYAADFRFGTPAALLDAGTSASYVYPGEKLTAFAHLNVSRAALEPGDRCEFLLDSAGKRRTLLELKDLTDLSRPQAAPDYIDTARLVQTAIDETGFAVHPWDEPALDSTVTVRLHGGKGGGPVAEAVSPPFGFLRPPPKCDLPDRIERTAVNARGLITVNGRPFFPVYWTPHFGVCPEAVWPPGRLGYKTLDLTDVVCPIRPMPAEQIKAAVLAKVAQVKDDPKFFQYELGDGEMQLQGPGWKDRLEQCKRAMEWIRAADPNHIINGPDSWLVGHPGHNETMSTFAGLWDAIGVEASFEQVPEVTRRAVPAMSGRRTAVLVGLETYFYQPNNVLRWRGYRALLNGASGVGLCPSGMMQSRPDKVNYLRGLNAEFRGLAPVFAANEPATKLAVSTTEVVTMERLLDGQRTVIAVRNSGLAGPRKVRFGLPAGLSASTVRVRFEARSIRPEAGGFEDDFAQPQEVHVYQLEP